MWEVGDGRWIHRLGPPAALLRAQRPRRIDRRGRVPARTSVQAKERSKVRRARASQAAPPDAAAPDGGQAAADGRHRRRDLAVRGRAADGAAPRRAARFHSIDGIPHFLSATAAAHLLELAEHFELVWASGWEEKANEHLPHLLGPARRPAVPALRARRSGAANAPLEARRDRRLRRRARRWPGSTTRFNDACHDWARRARGADAARADRARARAHRAGGASCCMGVGAAAGRRRWAPRRRS